MKPLTETELRALLFALIEARYEGRDSRDERVLVAATCDVQNVIDALDDCGLSERHYVAKVTPDFGLVLEPTPR
jgi:hypothetical protein